MTWPTPKVTITASAPRRSCRRPENTSGRPGSPPPPQPPPRPARVRRTGKNEFRIVLTQGLNRQIRRMCSALGYRVQRLQRVRIMNVQLGSLKPGEWRHLTEQELEGLLPASA